MKVFGIGFQRTGTTTLKECLQHLGFSHKGYDPDLLEKVHQGELEDVRRVADQYESFEDWPWPLLFRDLDAWYSEATFILTYRKDPETWLKSVKRHARLTGPTRGRQIVYGHARVEGYEETYLERYTQHNQAVREYFADRPDDLLEVCWETGSGWEDLCNFLDREVPDRPLPHTSRNTFTKWLNQTPKRWKRLFREAVGMPLE